MIEVLDLSEKEINELLSEVGFGHLACCRENRPYVVPIHYAFDDGRIFVYTTEGKKTDIIDANPNVCLQVEQVLDNWNWHSVIVNGTASRLPPGPSRDNALQAILAVNPTLTPAVSIRWLDEWVRENIEVIYLISPTSTTGRRSLNRAGEPPIVPRSETWG